MRTWVISACRIWRSFNIDDALHRVEDRLRHVIDIERGFFAQVKVDDNPFEFSGENGLVPFFLRLRRNRCPPRLEVGAGYLVRNGYADHNELQLSSGANFLDLHATLNGDAAAALQTLAKKAVSRLP